MYPLVHTQLKMSSCVKCKKVPEKCIDIKFAVYCSPCFQEATFHKYRSMLSHCSHQINQKDQIDHINQIDQIDSSTSLILLPRNFLSDRKVFQAGRLLIHFSQLPGILEPARKNLIKYHLAVVRNEKKDDFLVSFLKQIKTEYPKLGDIFILDPSKPDSDYHKFVEYNSISDISSENSSISVPENSLSESTLKEDYFNAIVLHASLRLMKGLSVSKALVPDTSTALAAYILCCTCKGRGRFLPWDSASIRDYPGGLYLVRPMKEISDREVELYCTEAATKLTDLMNIDDQKTTLTSSLSIDELTSNFTADLEAENPGTANVVIRTSAKVSTSTSINTKNDQNSRCRICFAPNDTNLCEPCSSISQYF